MQIPLQLKIQDVPKQPWIEALVRRRAEKLERYTDAIVGCRVTIDQPHKNVSSGNPFRVQIDVTIPPGHEILVRKDPLDSGPSQELKTVINAAFDAVERQVKDVVEKRRRDVKTHAEPVAFVVRKFDGQGYGFLKTPDGREIYFHQNAVVNGDYARIEVGTQVRFEESMGDMGPQATTVQIVDKPGHRPTEGGAVEPPAGW